MAKRSPIDNNRYCNDYREKHREKYQLYQREWRRKNAEVVKLYRKDAHVARAEKRDGLGFRCAVYPAPCPKQTGDGKGNCRNITRECPHQRSIYRRKQI
jgi:hypothetical protein